jgi:hypothetical protein
MLIFSKCEACLNETDLGIVLGNRVEAIKNSPDGCFVRQ